ncbi:MAG: sigma-54 dependent transcriptional regulator [Gemmatimonadota bacterium]
MSAGRLLLVDDDRAFRISTAALLREEGYEVVGAATGAEGVEALKAGRFDLLLLDLRMPGLDGIRIVEALRTWGEGIPILMISGYGTVEAAVEALHAGADDFLTKPVEPDVLSARVAQLLERRPGTASGAEAERPLVGRSPAIAEVLRQIEQVAPTEATVLVTGETGTGKELVARAIHAASVRRSGAFIAVNCAALAEGVLESELFGHVRGAFTGAVKDKVGLFQAADRGTLLLDEIGDVSPGLQQRLLRVLQEREVTRVGDVRPQRVDVRVVAATRRDLREEMEAGRFRDDLFYRLNVFRIALPPLRERAEDVPLLAEHRLSELSALAGRARPAGEALLSPLAMRMLRAYHWPGNVRELFSAIESAWIRSGGARIEGQHLPEEVREAAGGAPGSLGRYRAPETQPDEREAIRRALAEADGVRAKAAELLGMGRTTLWRKMKELGLEEAE